MSKINVAGLVVLLSFSAGCLEDIVDDGTNSSGTSTSPSTGVATTGQYGTEGVVTTTVGSTSGSPTTGAQDTSGTVSTTEGQSGTGSDATGEGHTEGGAVRDRTVFVTSLSYSGNLGGLSGADQQCQELAKAAQLEGDYMAWLSDDNEQASVRLDVGNDCFRLVNNEVVACFEILSGMLQTAITLDQNGMEAMPGLESYTRVWTGTTYEGVSTFYNCSNWHSASTQDGGGAGMSDDGVLDKAWTQMDIRSSCNAKFRLYCFQI